LKDVSSAVFDLLGRKEIYLWLSEIFLQPLISSSSFSQHFYMHKYFAVYSFFDVFDIKESRVSTDFLAEIYIKTFLFNFKCKKKTSVNN
jgi:hypothetical protein